MSVLGSSAFGVVKKRFQEINMKQKQKKLKTEIVGMPPSYITVDSSYDDYPLVANEEEMLLIYSNVIRKSYPSRTLYKSMLKDKQLTAMIVSGKDIDSVGEFLNHDIFQKLSVIKNYKSKMKTQKALNEISICNEFSRDHCLDPLAKDNEGNDSPLPLKNLDTIFSRNMVFGICWDIAAFTHWISYVYYFGCLSL